jgi:endonuclease YncB( thermonuclease family)
MPRAFIQNGIWRAQPAIVLDAQVQRQATFRVSIAAAIATLAFAALHDRGAPALPPEPVRAAIISAPEIIIAKADERVPAIPALASPYRRRAPLVETSEAAPSPAAAASGSPEDARPSAPAREALVLPAGMIRAGDADYRLSGIMLPENDRMCRRLDGLAVSCADRAQSYLQLLVKGRAVSCERAAQTSDGPPEANCRVGEADIAEQMVRQGWARATERPEERFLLAEAAAKKQKLGIWRE